MTEDERKALGVVRIGIKTIRDAIAAREFNFAFHGVPEWMREASLEFEARHRRTMWNMKRAYMAQQNAG